MADLTLPGDIPGLLRRGSPVWIRNAMGRWPAVVEKDPAEHDREGGHWMIKFGTHFVGSRSVFLDLSDPTGRAHAAWWLGNVPFDRVLAACDALGVSIATRKNAMESCMSPVEGWSHDADADVIRRIVLHIAGRDTTE